MAYIHKHILTLVCRTSHLTLQHWFLILTRGPKRMNNKKLYICKCLKDWFFVSKRCFKNRILCEELSDVQSPCLNVLPTPRAWTATLTQATGRTTCTTTENKHNANTNILLHYTVYLLYRKTYYVLSYIACSFNPENNFKWTFSQTHAHTPAFHKHTFVRESTVVADCCNNDATYLIRIRAFLITMSV